jgi:hydrogenase maturation protein HypF
VLAADYAGYRRLAHLLPVAMPGGAAAIREPWRMALAHLAACESWEEIRRDQGMLDVLLRAARKGINAPMTTSCDRLFDTVAALSGIRPDRITYEGQAAAELEAALYGASMRGVEGYRLALADAGALIFDPRPIWRPLLDDLAAGRPLAHVALRFHLGLVEALAAVVERLRQRHGGRRAAPVVLSGGSFQNAFLLRLLRARLARRGARLLTHRKVPPNDGGLAIGQAAIAAALSQGMTSACA